MGQDWAAKWLEPPAAILSVHSNIIKVLALVFLIFFLRIGGIKINILKWIRLGTKWSVLGGIKNGGSKGVPLWRSRLRIWRGHYSSLGHCCGVAPSLARELSKAMGVAKKKKKKIGGSECHSLAISSLKISFFFFHHSYFDSSLNAWHCCMHQDIHHLRGL